VNLLKILALLTCMTALAAACACSATSDGSSADLSGDTRTYVNEDPGFSLRYATRLTEASPSKHAGGASLFDVAFVDTSGARQDDSTYVDGLQVSVYELTRPVKPEEVPRLKRGVDTVAAQLLDTLPAAEVTEPLRETRIAGVPGFRVGYTYRRQGTAVTAASYFLFSGGYEYELTGQAGSRYWANLGSALEAAIHSFRVD
jgi:hypothetical protein